mmetsp:Transcript_38992/g.93852  ORF Transcript_38992/g.93852 Transcript_38992/m.93852 type:complete len:275 (+) Transcript_38992:91-915(+)
MLVHQWSFSTAVFLSNIFRADPRWTLSNLPTRPLQHGRIFIPWNIELIPICFAAILLGPRRSADPSHRRGIEPHPILHPRVHHRHGPYLGPVVPAREVDAPYHAVLAEVGLAPRQCGPTCDEPRVLKHHPLPIERIIHDVEPFVEVPHVQVWIILHGLGYWFVVVFVPRHELRSIHRGRHVDLVQCPLLVGEVKNLLKPKVLLVALFVPGHCLWQKMLDAIPFQQKLAVPEVHPVEEARAREGILLLPPHKVIIEARCPPVTTGIDGLAKGRCP